MKLIYLLFSLTIGYKYYSYQEIIETFKDLAQKHSEIFKLHYPLKGLENLRYLDCGEKECEFMYAEFATNMNQNNLPTILIAAGFHGDEIVGQNVVTELAKYLVNDKKLDFLNYRRIILYPMVNPYGYYHKVREEMGKDANRDFNVDNPSSICFQTNAARGLIQVYKQFIIQLGITFHGGDNSISYSWGTFNHLINNLSTEAPDDGAFSLIGQILRDTAFENQVLHVEEYKLGRMTDLVYAVHGGYEDWAYGAGWDKTNQCGNRNKDEYTQPSNNARALTYLIEAGYQKQPQENTLGSNQTQELLLQDWPPKYYYDNSELKSYQTTYGHINRNFMSSLAIIDISHPYLILKIIENNTLILNFGGCSIVNNVGILNSKNEIIIQKQNLTGIWSFSNKELEIKDINLSETIMIQYQCDIYQYSHQRNPDPSISPQSYFVQNRINNTYKFQLENYEIENTNVMSHRINFENKSVNEQWILHYNDNLNLEFNQIKITENNSKDQGSNQKQKVWWLLSIFILLSCVLSILFWKYCQKKQQEEVMEMYTIQNEIRV